MKETDLAKIFVDYLSCYDLYFEVDYGRCVDIVALNGKISIAYEVKTSFNFKVLQQALDNRDCFNYSYIAVPNFNDWGIQKRLCSDYGIGLLIYNNDYKDVREIVHPKLNRSVDNKRLFSRLSENNKKSKPGAKNGDGLKVTAFKVTVENAINYIERHPGCSMKEMISNISHHYYSDKSACGSMSQWIRRGVIKEIKLERCKLYLNE